MGPMGNPTMEIAGNPEPRLIAPKISGKSGDCQISYSCVSDEKSKVSRVLGFVMGTLSGVGDYFLT